jgi:hypothetical protein
LFDADALAGEDDAEIDLLPIEADAAACGHGDDFVVEWIKTCQLLPDLRRAPARLVVLEAHDLRLDLDRQLVGVAIGSTRAIGEPFQADLVIAGEDLVAGLAGNAELPRRLRL